MSACFGVPGWACEYRLHRGVDYDQTFTDYVLWGSKFYSTLVADKEAGISQTNHITTWDPRPLKEAIGHILKESDAMGSVHYLDGRLLRPWEHRVWRQNSWDLPRLSYLMVAGSDADVAPLDSRLVRLDGVRRSADYCTPKSVLQSLVDSWGFAAPDIREEFDEEFLEDLVVSDIVNCACGLLLGNPYIQECSMEDAVVGWALIDGWLTVDIGYVHTSKGTATNMHYIGKQPYALDLHNHTLTRAYGESRGPTNCGQIVTYWDNPRSGMPAGDPSVTAGIPTCRE